MHEPNPKNEEQQVWEEYRERELTAARPILLKLGFVLDEAQVHIGGERYLMMERRDVGGGGFKLVLLGKRTKDGRRVVIKYSSQRSGMDEIASEHHARELITNLDFAYHIFTAPEELLYICTSEYAVSVTAYIEQETTFLNRPIEEQFALVLKAFKTQEGVHATTYAHAKKIRSSLGMIHAAQYEKSFDDFARASTHACPDNQELSEAFAKARAFLQQHEQTVEQYCGFLTHADFVPHNVRIAESQIYLLDYASIHFGNKHESWARFLNFMMLHNPAMEHALLQYIKDNRAEEEYLSVRLMRIYKLGFLLQFYTNAVRKSSGNLRMLAQARIAFWTAALHAVLEDTSLSPARISEYQNTRDTLRSDEEKERQRELH